MGVNPYAYFDCLGICSKLKPILGDTCREELHAFAYLACLLWIYGSNSVQDWGYGFARTGRSAPYAYELEQAISELVSSGLVSDGGDGRLGITDAGQREYELLQSLPPNGQREDYLSGSCSTILIDSVGVVRGSIAQMPEIHAANVLASKRMLLQDQDVDQLRVQFDALRAQLGTELKDLMIPATAWMRYLSCMSGSKGLECSEVAGQ